VQHLQLEIPATDDPGIQPSQNEGRAPLKSLLLIKFLAVLTEFQTIALAPDAVTTRYQISGGIFMVVMVTPCLLVLRVPGLN